MPSSTLHPTGDGDDSVTDIVVATQPGLAFVPTGRRPDGAPSGDAGSVASGTESTTRSRGAPSQGSVRTMASPCSVHFRPVTDCYMYIECTCQRARPPKFDTLSDTLRSGRPCDFWTPLEAKGSDSLKKQAVLDASAHPWTA